MMRIITGTARGTKLVTLEGGNTRPTAERVKEAVFSMLQFELEGRAVLDLFAGSGQMALEALSRGAARATLIDASREAIAVIMENAKKTHLFERCRISCADWAAFVRGAQGRETYDTVFLDPPYGDGILPSVLLKLHEAGILAHGAAVVCETAEEEVSRQRTRGMSREELAAREEAIVLRDVFGDDAALSEKFTVERTAAYGRTRITVLRPVLPDVTAEV